ncbi:unnamed protein product [Cylindrotheca closterium]|uniref:Phosphoglycerate mutase family protein n=1 Tax=Cylindrotheca closterium TaxID=2856 RepID=A0AAD2CC10_9STRA|nr:unnamed protein product [Cylindrotheca closterium]
MTEALIDSQTSANDATTTKIRQIQVILLRHGEREDEAEAYDKSQKTQQERVDPALTVLGHQQSLGAWRNILAYVPNDKPVMIACSPLRRCIGTALMVAAAALTSNPEEKVPKIVLPTDDVNDQQDTAEGAEKTIPVLVMNGLGDCAAQMRHMGGIGKVVKAGWLACAASPVNDCCRIDTKIADTAATPVTTTPLQNSLRRIAKKGGHLQTRWGDTIVTQSCKLQLWRESKYHSSESIPTSDLSIMTEPRTIQEHEDAGAGSTSSRLDDPVPMPRNAPSAEEQFEQTLERAVLLTAHAGLETCILVTHREAIRWIEEHRVVGEESPEATGEDGEQQKDKLNLSAIRSTTRTYCCVADYKVSLDLTDSEKPQFLSWETQKIVPWSALHRDQE